MAKHALEAFSCVLRQELQPQGIEVVIVNISMVKTESALAWKEPLDGESLSN